MPQLRDDEFQLRFPVARDRTLRRIGLARMTLGIAFAACLVIVLVASRHTSMLAGVNNVYDFTVVIMIFCIVAIVTLFYIVEIFAGLVFTRRYGWRAVSDPIEAHRVASREALHDAATGNLNGMLETECERRTQISKWRLRRPTRPTELAVEPKDAEHHN